MVLPQLDGPSFLRIPARATLTDVGARSLLTRCAADDAANRAAVKEVQPVDLNFVGLALREDKKTVDKITKGAKLHS